MKCARCNRDRLETAEYMIKRAIRQHLCNTCAVLTKEAHGENQVKRLPNTTDDGLDEVREPKSKGSWKSASYDDDQGSTEAAPAAVSE